MKIKKLSILGFKSFMDRLEITFPLGISGVVGPNGCGKSNIVDAIRWGMGEQSSKELRGRRMEDVIFNGSGEQKPLGMAEVSIIFENGDGHFPTPFSDITEISVTRRLYRSGESEYRLNNVPCRLKDIQEVFMDTGLGNKAYSIIGQGRVGSILEQRPEDTRVMLEEAAGVTKYRKKVEASQKKIEYTETNLQRVEDILAEVQKQMRSLKRQAYKAKRYKAISGEIRDLELILYSNTYHQLEQESGNRLRSTDDLVRQQLIRTTEISKLHAQTETMNLELEEKDGILSGLRKDYLHLRDRVQKKEAGLEALAREIEMQDELKARLRAEQEELGHKLIGLEDEKTCLREKIDKVEIRSQDLNAEISLKDKMMESRRQFLNTVKRDFEKARLLMNEGMNQEVGLSHESSYLNKLLDEITDSKSRLEKELEVVRNKITKIIEASERNNLGREAAVERLDEIDRSIEHEKMNCEELEDVKIRVEADLKALETDLNLCKTRLISMQGLTENFEGYKMGVRTIMKAKDLEPLQEGRILGLVADLIEVDHKYEQAVEAVLADELQYIVVESQEDGEESVDYLRKQKKGRAGFIPLKDLHAKGNGQPMVTGFPLIRDLVSVPDELSSAVTALLGDTMVVDNLKEAISAWNHSGKDQCFVTIDGDIVDQRGVISGGKLARSSGGLLARKRETQELKEQAVVYGKKRDDSALKLEHIITQIKEKRDSIEALAEDRWTCQEEINEFDKILFRFGQELDQSEKLSQKISDDLVKKGKDQKRHNQDLLGIDEELHVLKARRREGDVYLQKKELELKEAEEEFDQCRDEVTKLKADSRVFREEQNSLIREIERLDNHADDSRNRLERIEEDISSGVMKCDEYQEKREAFKDELIVLYEKLKKAEGDTNRADRGRRELQDRIREKEESENSVRERIDVLKDEINRAKMEHSEISFKMNNLVEVTRDKFNINLHDIYRQHLDEDFSHAALEEKIERLKSLRLSLGEVNLMAIKEHEALKERYEFIKNQREDLIRSIESLRAAIDKINRMSEKKFKKVFYDVDKKLKEVFPILFNGGTAGLRLTNEDRPLESGVLVEVKPPGKRLSHMGLLSGGEKALVAMSLIFAIYMIKPSPFCLLDEVDAPLDEANIDRFNKLLKEIQKTSQIIVVTHNRRTMEIADRLYGITMEKQGISDIVSVDIHGEKNVIAQ